MKTFRELQIGDLIFAIRKGRCFIGQIDMIFPLEFEPDATIFITNTIVGNSSNIGFGITGEYKDRSFCTWSNMIIFSDENLFLENLSRVSDENV